MKTVVMTGGTSGIGQVAAQQILETPNTCLLLGARRNAYAERDDVMTGLWRDSARMVGLSEQA